MTDLLNRLMKKERILQQQLEITANIFQSVLFSKFTAKI